MSGGLSSIAKAVFLGIVEGLTEFLPVSSTGHLIIAGDLVGFSGAGAETFEIFIQLGAILAVVWLYRKKVTGVALSLGRRDSRRFVLNLFIGFLPAAVVGLLVHKAVKAHLFNPVSVAGALIAGGIAILLIERRKTPPRIRSVDDIGPLDALKVGLAQCFAIYPGVSRSGATIMGGLLAGSSRVAATEFSFFLSIPTMFAATLYDLYSSRELLSAADTLPFAVGLVVSFVVALAVVKLFLAWVGRHSFVCFAWYRMGFGLLVLWYFGPG